MVMIFWNQKTCFLTPLSLKHLNVCHYQIFNSVGAPVGRDNRGQRAHLQKMRK